MDTNGKTNNKNQENDQSKNQDFSNNKANIPIIMPDFSVLEKNLEKKNPEAKNNATPKLDLNSGEITGETINKDETANKNASGVVDLTSTPAMLALNISKDELKKVEEEVEIAKDASKVNAEEIPKEFGEEMPKEAPKETAKESSVTKDLMAKAKQEASDDSKGVDFFKNAALDEKSGGSKILENVSAQKVNLSKPDMNKLLGGSKILEKTIEQESLEKAKKQLNIVRAIAGLLFLIAAGLNGFFYYQLSPSLNLAGLYELKFENNLRSNLVETNDGLNSFQTTVNKYNYLTGHLYLTQFGFEATSFFDNVKALESPSTVNQRVPIQQRLENSKTTLSELLIGAKTNLTPEITIKNYPVRGVETPNDNALKSKFETDLKKAITDEKTNQQVDDLNTASDAVKRELSFIDNTKELVGNTALINALNRKDANGLAVELDEYIKGETPNARQNFESFVNTLINATKVDLATIAEIRTKRIVWSNVIDRIDDITRGVDRDHNAGNAANSRTTYNSYSFNSAGQRVSLSGVNTTNSGTNRAVTTVLLEKFNASPDFKNATNRSFPLSRGQDDNGNPLFTMNFRMDVTLEEGRFSIENGPLVDLSETGSANSTNTQVRRNTNTNNEQ